MTGRAALGLVMLALGLSGCFEERERLDTPVLSLSLHDDRVRAGDTIRGALQARDASGLLEWRVIARSAFDTVRAYGSVGEVTQLEQSFALPVVDTVPNGTAIEIEAVVLDNQSFLVARSDTVTVSP